MELIIGHTNSDLDCFGSMVLARYLYPKAVLVRSRLIHPVAQKLYSLYRNHLNMSTFKELRGEKVDRIIIVDTRTRARIKEFFECFPDFDGEIIIWDHHPGDTLGFENVQLHDAEFGANTTLIGIELMKQGVMIEPDDATIALTGIYADTGNFTYENVTEEDFLVAAYLRGHGANVEMVKNFLRKLSQKHQVTLFHEILNRVDYREIHGHVFSVSYMELSEQAAGLAAIVEKVHEVENSDATLCVFHFTKQGNTLIVARSASEDISVLEILLPFGGGGHEKAASAYLKSSVGLDVFQDLMVRLEDHVKPALTAADLMTEEVLLIQEDWTLLQASKFLESVNHTGAPVVKEGRILSGILTLRDIMKGRKNHAMHAPVKAYMAHKLFTMKPESTLREIRDLVVAENIGHLPVVGEGGEVLGLITRGDLIEVMQKQKRREAVLIENLKSLKSQSERAG